jgi:integrase
LAYDVLSRAVKHAKKLRVIAENPMEEIARPPYEEEEIFPFTPEEAAELFTESEGTRIHVAVVLGISIGLRIGEILGLPFAEIDLSGKQVKIVQQAVEVRGTVLIRRPKTKSSVRTIQLPDVAVDAINSHRAILLKEGLAGSDLLLPAREGGVERRTNFARRDWKPLLNRLDIEPRGFHHARHTYATLALGALVPIHVVSKVMGHKKPSTTLNIYAHALKGQQDQATQAMNLLFGKTA